MRLLRKLASQGENEHSEERAARARRMAGYDGEDLGKVGTGHGGLGVHILPFVPCEILTAKWQ
jgi:hypothetical protein